ncbi:hypothetical protein M5K25_008213 [Dendrobium thyrsiflorum]|uniref:Phospholipase/carboxylesterase/thioesterase domain-containing protein n=1 Tax=Dendrobium thyrsiflorum TaxID=117978 RepID=A0ABD0V8U0_DENTH
MSLARACGWIGIGLRESRVRLAKIEGVWLGSSYMAHAWLRLCNADRFPDRKNKAPLLSSHLCLTLLGLSLSPFYPVVYITRPFLATAWGRTNRRAFEFGRTHVVKPKGRHQATIVWLHGLGDNGASWSQLLETLPLPNIKWICPTAPTRPVAAFGGFPCTAWFDVGEFSENGPDDIEGMDASATHVANLLSAEPAGIQLGIGGFSMGASTALYSAVCCAYGRFGSGNPYPINLSVVVGLSGCLPCSRNLKNKVESSQDSTRRAASLPLLLCHGKGDIWVAFENVELTPPVEILVQHGHHRGDPEVVRRKWRNVKLQLLWRRNIEADVGGLHVKRRFVLLVVGVEFGLERKLLWFHVGEKFRLRLRHKSREWKKGWLLFGAGFKERAAAASLCEGVEDILLEKVLCMGSRGVGLVGAVNRGVVLSAIVERGEREM